VAHDATLWGIGGYHDLYRRRARANEEYAGHNIKSVQNGWQLRRRPLAWPIATPPRESWPSQPVTRWSTIP